MFALKRVCMPPDPTVIYTSTGYNAMLFGTVQYHFRRMCTILLMSVLTLPFSFTFVSMTITCTAGRTSQIICQKSETVSGVGHVGGHRHYCRLQYDNYIISSTRYISILILNWCTLINIRSYITHLVMQCRYLHVHPV